MGYSLPLNTQLQAKSHQIFGLDLPAKQEIQRISSLVFAVERIKVKNVYRKDIG